MEALVRAWNWLGFGTPPPPTRDHSRYNHSPGLLGRLQKDHGELLKLHGELERLAAGAHYAALPAALAAFRSKFDLHVLSENLNLYGYLEEKIAGRPEDQDLVRGFRSEMNAIARAVTNFIKKYRSLGVDAATAPDFLVELRQVGLLLIKRIEREEKDLYALYRP
ncbi:MAG: hemerythrin domain-containing protein [Nevskiaceae bacterium]